MCIINGDNWETPVSTRMGELLSSGLLLLLSNLPSHLAGYSRNYVFGEYSSYLLLVVAYSN